MLSAIKETVQEQITKFNIKDERKKVEEALKTAEEAAKSLQNSINQIKNGLGNADEALKTLASATAKEVVEKRQAAQTEITKANFALQSLEQAQNLIAPHIATIQQAKAIIDAIPEDTDQSNAEAVLKANNAVLSAETALKNITSLLPTNATTFDLGQTAIQQALNHVNAGKEQLSATIIAKGTATQQSQQLQQLSAELAATSLGTPQPELQLHSAGFTPQASVTAEQQLAAEKTAQQHSTLRSANASQPNP